MPSRTPAQAVAEFVELLQQALSCVTNAVLDVRGGYFPSDEPHAATLNGGIAVRLHSDAQLGLLVTLYYRIVEDSGHQQPWVVRTAAYYFALTDADDNELVAYPWHPAARSAVTWLHLHLGTFSQPAGLERVHLPTGRVALEQILRLAISELGVQPRRKDWATVLDRTQAAFTEHRTWA